MADIYTASENWKIFLQKESFTEVEENYLRVCLLLYNTGTHAVCIQFDKYFRDIKPTAVGRPNTLREIFDSYKYVLHDMKKKKQITDQQWALLYPKDQVDTSGFDISLMTMILNRFHSEGIIKLDESIQIALEEIRKLRNEILAHTVSFTLSNEEVNTVWEKVTQVIKQIGGDTFEQECDTWRVATLDSENTIILDAIKYISDIAKELGCENGRRNNTTNRHLIGKCDGTLLPTDRENFLRLCSLMMEIAPKAVRCFFDRLNETRLSKVNVDIGLNDSGVMSAQLRGLARKRGNLRVSGARSVPVPQLSTSFASNQVDTVITSSIIINQIYTDPVLCTSSNTFPATSTSTTTLLYSRVPVQRYSELGKTVTSQDSQYSLATRDTNNCSVQSMMVRLKRTFGFRILEDKLPDPSEKSSDADLTRINYYIKFIFDNKTPGSLGSTYFNEIWNTVSDAILRLGDVSMKQECDCLKGANIGEKKAKKLFGWIEAQQKIKVLREINDENKDRIEELQNPLSKFIKETEEWIAEDNFFVKTRASTLLLKLSQDTHNKSITVVGSFGVGKTLITRHVALVLKNIGYRILPVSKLAEIKEHDDEQIPTVFIVDDFCGRIDVKQRTCDIKMWKKMQGDLIGSGSKIIVCCESMIFKHHSFKSLPYFRSCVVDLNSPHLDLNYNEVRSIAQMHAHIDEELIEYACHFPCFPFICKQCSTLPIKKEENLPYVISHQDVSQIVKEIYESQLNNMRKEDKAKYTALGLLVMLNNYIKGDYFTKTSLSVLPEFDTILAAFGFDKNNSLSDIKEELESMTSSFIVVSTDSQNKLVYSAKNLELYIMLVTYFEKELPTNQSGSFSSKKNYSSFHSLLNNVHKRANILTTFLCSWLMVAIVVIGLFIFHFINLIFKGLENIGKSQGT